MDEGLPGQFRTEFVLVQSNTTVQGGFMNFLHRIAYSDSKVFLLG